MAALAQDAVHRAEPASAGPRPGTQTGTTALSSPAQVADSSAVAGEASLRRQEAALASIAIKAWRELPAADVLGAVESGFLAMTEQGSDGTAGESETAAHNATAATAETAATVQRQAWTPRALFSADWSAFGTHILPVLSASPGAGATLVSALLTDVLTLSGRRVLLVDTADPTRSGLTNAARSDGPARPGPHPAVRVRFSRRDRAVLARVDTTMPVFTPGMVPPPAFFHPGSQRVDVTVVDIAHDAWRLTAHPLAGAGAWLRRGRPAPRPVLVCRASRPSLLHAEQVLARVEAWNANTVVPQQLVVVGAKRWPAGVAGSAGRRTATLLDTAVFIPHDSDLAVSGVTAELTSPRTRQPLSRALSRLIPAMSGSSAVAP